VERETHHQQLNAGNVEVRTLDGRRG